MKERENKGSRKQEESGTHELRKIKKSNLKWLRNRWVSVLKNNNGDGYFLNLQFLIF
jgi:hypothetical protein